MSWTRTSSGTAGNGNNAAALTPGLPAGWAPGDLHVLEVQTYGGTGARRPSLPSGWTSVGGDAGWANGTAYHAVYWRVAVAGDVAPTVTMTGAGVANDTQLSQIHGFRPTSALHIPTLRVAGTPSTNASADNVGPITGITPAAGDLVLLSVGKTNDWNGTATLAGTTLAAQNESTTGNDAGSALLYQLSSGGAPTGNLTVADNGATASAGLGFGVLAAFEERDTTPGIEVFVSAQVGDGVPMPPSLWTPTTGAFRSRAYLYLDASLPYPWRIAECKHTPRRVSIALVAAPNYILDAIKADPQIYSAFPARAADMAGLAAIMQTTLVTYPLAWRNAARDMLEGRGVNCEWITAATTVRDLIGHVIRLFNVTHTCKGELRAAARDFLRQGLDQPVSSIPAAQRTDIEAWLNGRGVDTSWITGATTVREVVASLPALHGTLFGRTVSLSFAGETWNG